MARNKRNSSKSGSSSDTSPAEGATTRTTSMRSAGFPDMSGTHALTGGMSIPDLAFTHPVLQGVSYRDNPLFRKDHEDALLARMYNVQIDVAGYRWYNGNPSSSDDTTEVGHSFSALHPYRQLREQVFSEWVDDFLFKRRASGRTTRYDAERLDATGTKAGNVVRGYINSIIHVIMVVRLIHSLATAVRLNKATRIFSDVYSTGVLVQNATYLHSRLLQFPIPDIFKTWADIVSGVTIDASGVVGIPVPSLLSRQENVTYATSDANTKPAIIDDLTATAASPVKWGNKITAASGIFLAEATGAIPLMDPGSDWTVGGGWGDFLHQQVATATLILDVLESGIADLGGSSSAKADFFKLRSHFYEAGFTAYNHPLPMVRQDAIPQAMLDEGFFLYHNGIGSSSGILLGPGSESTDELSTVMRARSKLGPVGLGSLFPMYLAGMLTPLYCIRQESETTTKFKPLTDTDLWYVVNNAKIRANQDELLVYGGISYPSYNTTATASSTVATQKANLAAAFNPQYLAPPQSSGSLIMTLKDTAFRPMKARADVPLNNANIYRWIKGDLLDHTYGADVTFGMNGNAVTDTVLNNFQQSKLTGRGYMAWQMPIGHIAATYVNMISAAMGVPIDLSM